MQKTEIIRQHTQNPGALFNFVNIPTSFKLLKCTAFLAYLPQVCLCDLHRDGAYVFCTHLSPSETLNVTATTNISSTTE
jgi:hypothetical protein